MRSYQVVVFTNQGGLTLHADPKSKAPKAQLNRVPAFKQKCSVVLSHLNIPIRLYAATANDSYRKPRPGMWMEMKDDYGLTDEDIDHEKSIFVGDAGGRAAEIKGKVAIPKDFSCSDRNLAHNIGIPFQTPEEFFLQEAPRGFSRDFDLAHFPFLDENGSSAPFDKKNKQDIVLFVGPPGAGKSTFYWRHLKPLGYERVNQDQLKSKDNCFKAAIAFLKEGESIAIGMSPFFTSEDVGSQLISIDNTNPDPDIRARWIDLAKKHKVPIRCVWFKTPLQICEHNDVVRSLNKPVRHATL
jgi:bifunctional polynucleotide phosphatase/kinase